MAGGLHELGECEESYASCTAAAALTGSEDRQARSNSQGHVAEQPPQASSGFKDHRNPWNSEESEVMAAE